eukprot:UN24401
MNYSIGKRASLKRVGSTGDHPIRLYFSETTRPHFWYWALVNCDENTRDIGTKVSWDIHAWQGEDAAWTEEYSFNERGLNTLYLVFLILYPFVLVIQAHSWHVHSLGGIHHIIRLVSTILILEFHGVFFTFVNYVYFANEGRNQPFCYVVGGLFMITASTLFLFVLFLIAQGWIISFDGRPRYVKSIDRCMFCDMDIAS